jgi:succinate dehydrogenase hydrophobic anchor subunit
VDKYRSWVAFVIVFYLFGTHCAYQLACENGQQTAYSAKMNSPQIQALTWIFLILLFICAVTPPKVDLYEPDSNEEENL